MIEQVDFLARMIAIGAAMMLLAQLVSGDVRKAIKLPAIGMIIGVIAYLLNSSPLMGPENALDPLVDLVSIFAPLWIWLFARRLFEREPNRRVVLIAAASLTVSWFFANFVAPARVVAFYFTHIVALALIVDLVRVGLTDRDDDLVEQRRIIRLWLPLLVAAQAGGILVFEMIFGATNEYPLAQLINTVMILLITLFAGLALLRTDPELLVEFEKDAPDEERAPLDLSPSESVLHEKLMAAMADGTYRETGLTIAALAEKLDTPEHRLRALINQRLGHRNFSAFLNRYRIAEAREKLASREDVDLPVLTIAMDLGYNSLPTFNRAFRAETGTTPSEFRRLSFNGEGAPEAEQN
ncbi:AraC family transcriptional regulator [Erythrobacter sp. THAF29]|uniref:helix-turn-helix domain-containing protein n=1 Tax=Erythrobacter sp. THAF29 TaxID=2587851 RepID=UPI0012696424|nr:helix-turn-helix domain-containing protein [Erythrobacter sp. THAF29]QFT77302.1 DNA-binding transcriptional regulator SoxS [Erythrobacter sp. THAF29]